MKSAIVLQTRYMDILLARGSLFPLSRITLRTLGAKYDIERVMLHNGFFFFQFSSRKDMEQVLENGLSLISTKLRRPIMLDAYISNMCVKSWGRNTYARAFIEAVRAAESTKAYDDGFVEVTRKKERKWLMNKSSTFLLLKNSFDALSKEDNVFKSDDDKGTVTSELASSIIDSDIEEVEEVFVEKDLSIEPMDGEVDDARKKVEAPPKKTPGKTGIWSGRKVNSPNRNVAFYLKQRFTALIRRISRKWSMRMPIARKVYGLSYGYWHFL
ncbi:hypothetical protein Tco_0581389 [Tanacetum coccineum]